MRFDEERPIKRRVRSLELHVERQWDKLDQLTWEVKNPPKFKCFDKVNLGTVGALGPRIKRDLEGDYFREYDIIEGGWTNENLLRPIEADGLPDGA